ncbi:DgyrCDS8430 [Dimorphilus gyrociliatus]|uniref:DgyrCDS8430 n=1 Tax=Dimorphilus gyrociliatus TaxID=2664684 RepID=A0A7I8VV52_9ANNE|nr:DgyrCDS8430 [Dimorphilus gyrociliatus]
MPVFENLMKKIRSKKKKEEAPRELQCYSKVVRSITNEAVYVSPSRYSIEEALRSSTPSSHVYEEIPEDKLDPTITEIWSKSSTRTNVSSPVEVVKEKLNKENAEYLDLSSRQQVSESCNKFYETSTDDTYSEYDLPKKDLEYEYMRERVRENRLRTENVYKKMLSESGSDSGCEQVKFTKKLHKKNRILKPAEYVLPDWNQIYEPYLNKNSSENRKKTVEYDPRLSCRVTDYSLPKSAENQRQRSSTASNVFLDDLVWANHNRVLMLDL